MNSALAWWIILSAFVILIFAIATWRPSSRRTEGRGYYDPFIDEEARTGPGTGFGNQTATSIHRTLQLAPRNEADKRGLGPKGYRRSDERILEDISDRLMNDEHIDASEVIVEVRGGIVFLRGIVDTRASRRMAEEIVEQVAGIQDIRNDLKIRGRTDPSTRVA